MYVGKTPEYEKDVAGIRLPPGSSRPDYEIDRETGERYTGKRYESEKAASEDGTWRHVSA